LGHPAKNLLALPWPPADKILCKVFCCFIAWDCISALLHGVALLVFLLAKTQGLEIRKLTLGFSFLFFFVPPAAKQPNQIKLWVWVALKALCSTKAFLVTLH